MDDETEDIEIEDDIQTVKGRFTQTTPSTNSQKSQSQKTPQKLTQMVYQKKKIIDEDEELEIDDLPVAASTNNNGKHSLGESSNPLESSVLLFEESQIDYDPVARTYALVNFNDELILYIHPSEEEVEIDDEEDVIKDSDDEQEKNSNLIVDCLQLELGTDQQTYSFNKKNTITLTPQIPESSGKGKSFTPQNCELLDAKMVFTVELGRKAPFVLYRYILQGKGVIKCVCSLAKLEINVQAKQYSAKTVQDFEINLNPQEVILADGPTVIAFDYSTRLAFISQCTLGSTDSKKTKTKKNNNNNPSKPQPSWYSRFMELPVALQKTVFVHSLLSSGSWMHGPTIQLIMRACADFVKSTKKDDMDVEDDFLEPDPLAESSPNLKLELPPTSLLGPFFVSLDIGNQTLNSPKAKLKAVLWSQVPFEILLRSKCVHSHCAVNETKPSGFFIATNDCRLVKVQHGHVLQTATVKPALPLSIHTGCVDNSLNVVLVVCKQFSGTQFVKVFDASSLQLLQEFSSRGDVLMGDFLNVGHDFMLLIDSKITTKHSIEFLKTSSLITDLTLTLANQKVTQAKTLAGKENLQSVALSLETRTQTALKELTLMEWNIQQKEKMLQNCFQLLQCMVADPRSRDPVAVPKISDVVPLFKPAQVPGRKTMLAEDVVKKQQPVLLVEKITQNVFGKKLGVSLTVKNISKDEIILTNAFLVGDHYRLETTSVGEEITVAPEQQHTIYASCDLPHSVQRSTLSFSLICGFRLKKNANESKPKDQPSQLSQSQQYTQQSLIKDLENSTKYQIAGTVVVTPQMSLGITTDESKLQEPVFLTSIDLALLASPEWKPQDIIAAFSKALHLRTLAQRESTRSEFELGCADRDRVPLAVQATSYHNYVEVTLKAIDQSDIAKAIQVLKEQLHPGISMQFNMISYKVLGIVSDFQRALTAEFKFLEKWRDTFRASRDSSMATQQLLQFKKDYMTCQIETDQLFAKLVSVLKD